jgi:hypothetical protein
MSKVVPQLRQLDIQLLTKQTWVRSRPVYLVFVVGTVALGEVFSLENFGLPLVIIPTLYF